MKQTFIPLLAFAIICFSSCASKDVKYVINGTNAPKEGARVYLIDQARRAPIDSAVVSGGTFTMKGKAEKDAFMSIRIDGITEQFPFFIDGQPVHLDVSVGELTGSSLNNKLSDCEKLNKAAYAEYERVIRVLEELDTLPQEEGEAKVAEYMPTYFAALRKYADFYVGMIEENKNSLIPIAFIEYLPSVVSAADNWNKAAGEQKLDEILAANPRVGGHPYALDLKQRMAASDAQRKQNAERQRSIVGEKFRDLVEPDPDGKSHKLSEYVGQGEWILVDFWASWCGPCRAEMPNVVAAYEKYHGKGFEIVGLSFDKDKDEWVNAIKEWGMPWIQLSDLKYWETVAAGVYSVTGIPDNLLIDPEGTIIARGLRGEELEAKLSEIFQ